MEVLVYVLAKKKKKLKFIAFILHKYRDFRHKQIRFQCAKEYISLKSCVYNLWVEGEKKTEIERTSPVTGSALCRSRPSIANKKLKGKRNSRLPIVGKYFIPLTLLSL